MTEVSQLDAMLAELRARCPTLSPAVVPTGCEDREHGTALLALCRDVAERKALVALLSAERRAAARCAITERETPEQELRFVSFWELDPARATFQLRRCAFVCADVATLRDVPGFLQRYTRPGADVAQLSALASTFCLANAHDEQAAKPMQARLWLQECCSLAYSCQVVASSCCASWTLLAPDGTPLSEVPSLVELVRTMLSPVAAADKKKKTKSPKAKRGDQDDDGDESSQPGTATTPTPTPRKKRKPAS
tara:strand:- start:2055 stop:2807 length:753 start_codon:yes stop_codon:yes gene_type:complete